VHAVTLVSIAKEGGTPIEIEDGTSRYYFSRSQKNSDGHDLCRKFQT